MRCRKLAPLPRWELVSLESAGPILGWVGVGVGGGWGRVGGGGGGGGGGGYTKWGFPQQRSQTPDFACQTHNVVCQTPNFLCQTHNIPCQTPRISKPNTQHFVPNTQHFEAKHPKSRSIFSKISEQSPNTLGHAPSSLEPLPRPAEPSLCAQRGQMRGLRPVGPKPPL